MNSISVCEEENVEFINVELPSVVVHSLYKPPPEPFLLPPLGQRIKPHIVIGDFNSHSTLWGYTTTDSDGEAVEQGQIQTDCHSFTTRNCRNHSTVQYGRRDTTRTSSLQGRILSTATADSAVDALQLAEVPLKIYFGYV